MRAFLLILSALFLSGNALSFDPNLRDLIMRALNLTNSPTPQPTPLKLCPDPFYLKVRDATFDQNVLVMPIEKQSCVHVRMYKNTGLFNLKLQIGRNVPDGVEFYLNFIFQQVYFITGERYGYFSWHTVKKGEVLSFNVETDFPSFNYSVGNKWGHTMEKARVDYFYRDLQRFGYHSLEFCTILGATPKGNLEFNLLC